MTSDSDSSTGRPLALTIESLREYMRAEEVVPSSVAIGEISKLAGGVSSDIYLVRTSEPPDLVLKQALPNLRVEVDWPSDPERIHREASAMRWLGGILPEGMVPKQVHEDHAQHVLVMEAVPEPRPMWKSLLLQGDIQTNHVEAFARMLATIHLRGRRELAELQPTFSDRTFFESLRLEAYYEYSATQVPSAAEFLYRLCTETRSLQLTFVHGDFSPKNVLVRGDRLVLLDHETAHIGDPGFDIGFAMAHFLSKANHLPAHRAEFKNAAHGFWGTYLSEIGHNSWDENFGARSTQHVLACTLARARGRSPVEYLGVDKLRRQSEIIQDLVETGVDEIDDAVEAFVGQL